MYVCKCTCNVCVVICRSFHFLSFHLVAPLYFCYCHILVHVPPVYHCAISSVTVMRLELLRMVLHY